MSFTSVTRNVSILAILGLLPAGLLAGQTVTATQRDLEEEGTQLISQLEDVAREAQYHAGQLETSRRSTQTSKETRAIHLTQIRELVNDELRPALQRLTEIQPQLPAWHQDAIDRMLASAKALAADTNSAILSHNDNGSLPIVMNEEYRELITGINEHSEALVRTSDAAADYAKAHLRAGEAGLMVPRQ